MIELWDVQMIHQDDDIAIDKYNYLKDMLVSTIERKLHQVRYVNMMKDDIKREIEIGSGVKFKIDKGELHFIIELLREISNNLVCATSKGSDQPAHTRRLIRAFASRLSIL